MNYFSPQNLYFAIRMILRERERERRREAILSLYLINKAPRHEDEWGNEEYPRIPDLGARWR
jgi:hypothetical protein